MKARIPLEAVLRIRAFWRDGRAEAGSARMLAFERTLLDATPGSQRDLIEMVVASADHAIAAAVDRLVLRADATDDATDLIMSALWMHAGHGHPVAAAAYERFRSLLEPPLE